MAEGEQMQDELGNLLMAYPVRIVAKTAKRQLHRVYQQIHADAVDPILYQCRRCKTTWDDTPLRDYEQVTCSNCYSENVLIISVRLMFRNWGRQNGGKREQRDRYRAAKRKVKATRDK